MLCHLSSRLKLMVRYHNGIVQYAPLYIHTFKPILRDTNAEQFLLAHPDPAQLTNTADKLRYYRYRKGLRQEDVADYAGIYRTTYINYENHERDYYPPQELRKIAELLDVEFEELLDDYNRFLHNGQAQQIRMIRKNMEMTQYQFGKLMGVTANAVKRWESNSVTILKSKWEKLLMSKG